MNTPLYMVTSGQYSDYHVKGIYSTLEKAEYAKKLLVADNKITELELDALPKHPEGMMLYCVVMDRYGNSSRSRDGLLILRLTQYSDGYHLVLVPRRCILKAGPTASSGNGSVSQGTGFFMSYPSAPCAVMNGDLDEVLVFNRAWSAQEVYNYYQQYSSVMSGNNF